MQALGKLFLIELYDCDLDVLKNASKVREIMLVAARAGRATIVRDVFHQFSPHGVSGVVVISESHLAIHTWPEHGYAAVDLFTCSTGLDVGALEASLREGFRALRVERFELNRGRIWPARTTVTQNAPA